MAKSNTADTSGISKALEKKEDRPIQPGMKLSELMQTDTIKGRFSDVLGKKAAAFMSSIVSAVSANPYLQTCEPLSVIAAAMIAATLDLVITPSLGFAYIVPYKGKATFQIGWKGIYQLAMRSGMYKTINAATVFEGELIKHDKFKGLMEFDCNGKKSDDVLGYVLYFELLNGFERYFYMTAAQMESHGKKYSERYKKGKGLWKDDFDAAAHKTVYKLGLGKFGPLSVEMQKAFEADQAVKQPDGSFAWPDNPDGDEPENGEKSPVSGVQDAEVVPESSNGKDQRDLKL